MDFRARVASGAALGVVAVLAAFACGGPQEPAEEGANCYRDADCKVGLVCVPQGDERTCSSEIGGLVSQVEQPPPPPPPDAGGEPVDGG